MSRTNRDNTEIGEIYQRMISESVQLEEGPGGAAAVIAAIAMTLFGTGEAPPTPDTYKYENQMSMQVFGKPAWSRDGKLLPWMQELVKKSDAAERPAASNGSADISSAIQALAKTAAPNEVRQLRAIQSSIDNGDIDQKDMFDVVSVLNGNNGTVADKIELLNYYLSKN